MVYIFRHLLVRRTEACQASNRNLMRWGSRLEICHYSSYSRNFLKFNTIIIFSQQVVREEEWLSAVVE